MSADGTKLSFWGWSGDRSPSFLLIHGLASNARLWDGVARLLQEQGFPVLSVDLRGHGQSNKPTFGYDFATMAGDLVSLIGSEMDAPVLVVGQSYGANLGVELATRHPDPVAGLVCVDGGFIDLASRFEGDWEACLAVLKPPPLDHLRTDSVWAGAVERYPGWPDEAIGAQLANLEDDGAGGVRRRLSLENHITILRSMFEEDPKALANNIGQPVMVLAADEELPAHKAKEVSAFATGLRRGRVRWLKGHHDLHAEQPYTVVEEILEAQAQGFFA